MPELGAPVGSVERHSSAWGRTLPKLGLIFGSKLVGRGDRSHTYSGTTLILGFGFEFRPVDISMSMSKLIHRIYRDQL